MPGERGPGGRSGQPVSRFTYQHVVSVLMALNKVDQKIAEMYLDQLDHGIRHLRRLLNGEGPEPRGSPLPKQHPPEVTED